MYNEGLFNELLNIAKFARKSAWFGYMPVVDADPIDFCKGTNYRVSADIHGKYDLVWLYENSLLHNSNWPLILDESIRLFSESGLLIIRFKESAFGTVFALKQHIGRSILWKAEVIIQSLLKDGSIVLVVKINRLNYEEKSDKSWSIGVLSNGLKPKNVIHLFDSISEQITEQNVEYIVAGPRIDGLSKYNVIYVSEYFQDDLPRISQKKNEIIDASKNVNIAIFHDRYFVNEGFFEGFEKFGYDFEYVTVRQNYESGEAFPSYTGFLTREYKWQNPCFVSEFDHLMVGAFLNGGLIVLKNKLAKQLKFNHLLLHNEAEDVEFAWQLRLNGVIPRINALSSATTLGLVSSYTNTFVKFPINTNLSITTFRLNSNTDKLIILVWKIIPVKLKMIIGQSKFYEKAKRKFFDR